MARAHRIWIVENSAYQPIAAFTVKHECKKWLQTEDAKMAVWVAVLSDGGPERMFNGRQMVKVNAIPVWDVKSFIEEA